MAQYDFSKALQLGNAVQDYAKELDNADKIRLAGFLLGLVNAVQQEAAISRDAMWHAQEETMLFADVEQDDPMDASYHLHNMLENIADDFDTLADIVAECEPEEEAYFGA